MLHAPNTSALGVARLRARSGENFGRTPSYCACLTASEIEAIQPSIIVLPCAEIGGCRPRGYLYIDSSQPARPEAIQSDLQGPKQAIVDYCNLKLFLSPESSPCYIVLVCVEGLISSCLSSTVSF